MAPPALRFEQYEEPRLQRAVPAGASPGTAVTLVGNHLEGGDASTRAVAHSCRFGEVVVPATLHRRPRVVDGAWEANTVSCVVPPAASPLDGGSVRLSLSLNGQQYTAQRVHFAIARCRSMAACAKYMPGHAAAAGDPPSNNVGNLTSDNATDVLGSDDAGSGSGESAQGSGPGEAGSGGASEASSGSGAAE